MLWLAPWFQSVKLLCTGPGYYFDQ